MAYGFNEDRSQFDLSDLFTVVHLVFAVEGDNWLYPGSTASEEREVNLINDYVFIAPIGFRISTDENDAYAPYIQITKLYKVDGQDKVGLEYSYAIDDSGLPDIHASITVDCLLYKVE